jgi:hypothetical protein
MLLSLLLIGFHCAKPNWGTWTFVILNSWILAAGYWSKAMFMREKIHHFGPIEMFEGEAAFLAYAAAGLAAIHVVLIALPPRKVLRASQEHQSGFPSLDELE